MNFEPVRQRRPPALALSLFEGRGMSEGWGGLRGGFNSFTIRTINLPERFLGLNKQGYVNLSPSHAPNSAESQETAPGGVCAFQNLFI